MTMFSSIRLRVLLLLRYCCFVHGEWYSNVTLKSSDLSVVVYLPESLSAPPDNRHVYYDSSRFEHGSMIGSITRRSHELYGTDLWRIPHNSGWAESGVGLASEFGVGDNGAFCNYRCGWYGVSGVSNGVLGYIEAKNGEPFLKIGVGMLVKGSCNSCDSSEDYKFNSPYRFAEMPQWTLTQPLDNQVVLQHEAVMHAKKFYGYRLKKQITLQDSLLEVVTELTNLGQDAFTTPWYSHHFYSCDGRSIGPGYGVDLHFSGKHLYDEPSLWTWSTPLADYADISTQGSTVRVDMDKPVPDGVRIKAEFVKDETTDGSFTLRGCGTAIRESIPQVLQGGRNDGNPAMYAMNLYVERATLSPEILLLLHLEPGKSITWTQRLEFQDDDSGETMHVAAAAAVVNGHWLSQMESGGVFVLSLLAVAALFVVSTVHYGLNMLLQRRRGYMPIPNGSESLSRRISHQQQPQQQQHV